VIRDDKFYIAGAFQASVTLGTTTLTSVGSIDIFLAAYTSNGDLLWARRAGGPEEDAAHRVVVDHNDNLLIAGYVGTTADFGAIAITNGDDENGYLAKYDSAGTPL
jgi:hypothetical protein